MILFLILLPFSQKTPTSSTPLSTEGVSDWFDLGCCVDVLATQLGNTSRVIVFLPFLSGP